MCFFIGIIRVIANENYNYTYTGVEMWGSDVETANTAIINLTDSNGNIFNTYCIDYNTGIESKHNYSIVNVEDASYIDKSTADIIRNIVINAYPFSNLEHIQTISGIDNLTEEEAIAGAQAAIWHYANKKEFELLDNIKLLYDYYLTLDKSNINSTNISKLEIINNTYFEEGVRNTLISINSTNIFDLNYTFNKDLETEYGATLESNNNQILIKNIPLNAEFEINVNAKQIINNNVYFFYPKEGETASQSLVGVSSGIINISNSKKIKIEDNYYKLNINKIDSTTIKGIPGVSFKISNTKDFDDYVIDAITNEEGIIIIDNIPNGKWYIKEVTTPEGYIPNKEITTIEVKDKDTSIDITNNQYGKIKITKENELGEKLDNVSFDLYKDKVNENNLIKKDIITNKLGEALIENLDKGKYILIETKTKEGHLLNTDEIIIDVDYGKTSDINIINETIGTGNLIIRKLDSGNNRLLEGSTIGIYKDKNCKELYMEVITSNEELIINNLPSGKYYIKEISSPKGYILNLDTYQVEITKNQTSNVEILNNKIYNTASNHYYIFILGITSLCIFTILYLGYKLCLRKQSI